MTETEPDPVRKNINTRILKKKELSYLWQNLHSYSAGSRHAGHQHLRGLLGKESSSWGLSFFGAGWRGDPGLDAGGRLTSSSSVERVSTCCCSRPTWVAGPNISPSFNMKEAASVSKESWRREASLFSSSTFAMQRRRKRILSSTRFVGFPSTSVALPLVIILFDMTHKPKCDFKCYKSLKTNHLWWASFLKAKERFTGEHWLIGALLDII